MNKKLIMCRGVPGSGKSYWAEQEKTKLDTENVKAIIVNKDNIRKELTAAGWQWSPEREKDVIKIRNSSIKGAFAQGATVVISSDTNFGKHEETLRGIAKGNNAEFEIKDFTDVPLEICIERDSKREASIGPEVIRDMYEKYVAPEIINPYIADIKKPQAIICDLDGTLALHNGRSPFDYARVGEDSVNEPVASIVSVYARIGYMILYLSGREDSCKELTFNWLASNNLTFYKQHELIMRPAGDHRKDSIVKRELFDKYVRYNYNVRFVLDDRPQVLRMWRALGLFTLAIGDLKEF